MLSLDILLSPSCLLSGRDVTKLVKIRIRRMWMWIVASKQFLYCITDIRRNNTRWHNSYASNEQIEMSTKRIYFISGKSECSALHWFRSTKWVFQYVFHKSVFIIVPCNTSLGINYFSHSYVTVVCVIGWIWGKKLVSLRSLSVCAYEISRRTRIFPRIRIRRQSV